MKDMHERNENHIKTLEFSLKMHDKKLADGLKRTDKAIRDDMEKLKFKKQSRGGGGNAGNPKSKANTTDSVNTARSSVERKPKPGK